jgi:transcriptional regulator with PAS, ATPase and Fis domain
MPLQSKLLSVLQNREITKVGSDLPIPIDIRLVSATNKPVLNMIKESQFREDLLYRINTIQIEIPPLRDRTDDIPVLADHFLDEFSVKYNKGPFEISRKAYENLIKHPWYGNIRELKHTIEKAVILSDERLLNTESFFTDLKPASHFADSDNLNLAENEKALIIRALEKCKGNVSMTAKRLGINRSTLYEKMKKYEI